MPFTLTAVQVPNLPVFSGLYDPTSGPLTSRAFITGDTTNIRPYLNENSGRQDLLGRFGGGGNAVIHGLVLSAGTGLSVNVSAGTAMLDGAVPFNASALGSLTNNTRNHIWLERGGNLSATTTLTAPGTTYCYLGSALTAAEVVSSLDQSGVLYLLGGRLFRRTADTTVPADTPPAQLQFFHRGASKLWFWDGTSYWLCSVGTTGITIAESVVPITTNTTLSAAQIDASVIRITNGGGLAAGWVVSFPSASVVLGQQWIVRNDSGVPGRLTLQGGSDEIYVNTPQNVLVAYTDAELKLIGRIRPTSNVGTDYVVTNPKTWSTIEEVFGDHFEYVPSGGNVTVNYPNAGALGARGMRQTIFNDHTTSYLVFQTSGAATRPDYQTYLLPGEIQGFLIRNDGQLVRDITRPYQPLVTVQYGSDANKTVAHPDFLAVFITATSSGSLTATRDFVLPTVTDHAWYVRNNTTGGQKIVVKTAAGTGVTIQNGQAAWVYGDGTNILPGSSPMEHRTTVYPVHTLFGLVTAKTVANPTTAETTLIDATGALGTVTIPALWFLPGRSVRVKAAGVYGSAAGTTLNVRIKFGSTVILATGDQSPAAATDYYWSIDAEISCRTAGAGGTVMAESAFTYLAGATGNLQAWGMVNTTAVTVDTTATQAVDLTADWGAGVAAGDTITLHTLTIELLG
jgi:hypothetical protein